MEAHDKAALVTARLDDLVLGRIATSARPLAHGAIAQALRPFAPASYDEARWSTAIFEATARLTAAGDLDDQRQARNPDAAAEARFAATGELSWKRLHEQIVPALALGVTDARGQARLKGRDAWVAATIGRALALWIGGPPPTLGAVCDALVWHALGLPGRPRRTPPELRAHFVSQVLGAGTGSVERRAALLAARETGAVRADLRALREALVRRWLCGQAWSADDFATTVRTAAERTTDGVFGERKVFISSLWRDPAFASVTLDDFKRRLIAAHQAGTVSLARADLIAAMDPDLVRESEISHLETRYHFVERRGRS